MVINSMTPSILRHKIIIRKLLPHNKTPCNEVKLRYFISTTGTWKDNKIALFMQHLSNKHAAQRATHNKI